MQDEAEHRGSEQNDAAGRLVLEEGLDAADRARGAASLLAIAWLFLDRRVTLCVVGESPRARP